MAINICIVLFDRAPPSHLCLQAAVPDSAQQNYILLRYGEHKLQEMPLTLSGHNRKRWGEIKSQPIQWHVPRRNNL